MAEGWKPVGEQLKDWSWEEWPRICWNWNLNLPCPRWFAASHRAGTGGRVMGWWCSCHGNKAWVILSFLTLSPNNSYLPIAVIFQSAPQCLCINSVMKWSWCCPPYSRAEDQGTGEIPMHSLPLPVLILKQSPSFGRDNLHFTHVQFALLWLKSGS